MNKAFYVNSKNERIVLTITKHAKDRFTQRWSAAFPSQEKPSDINLAIINFFNGAVRHQNFSRKEKTRLKRYGKDTLFFKIDPLTFVVKDAKIITVELNRKDLRCLNKCSSVTILNHFEKRNKIHKKKPKLLRLAANTINNDGLAKFVNLGSFPLQKEHLMAEELNKNFDFITYLKNKIAEKTPVNSEIIEILGSYGKDMNKFCIFDQLQIKTMFSDTFVKTTACEG